MHGSLDEHDGEREQEEAPPATTSVILTPPGNGDVGGGTGTPCGEAEQNRESRPGPKLEQEPKSNGRSMAAPPKIGQDFSSGAPSGSSTQMGPTSPPAPPAPPPCPSLCYVTTF
ncbi:hypothetical protein OPQ81_004331 [Rhizoctonia solani]|nr:hypothetical protein OPQ81_004331 [Rhizoctonia solani]